MPKKSKLSSSMTVAQFDSGYWYAVDVDTRTSRQGLETIEETRCSKKLSFLEEDATRQKEVTAASYYWRGMPFQSPTNAVLAAHRLKGKNMKTVLGLLLSTLMVSSTSFANMSEPLMGLAVTEDSIVYTVSTGGCTSKADFRVDQRETFPVQLDLIRIKPDLCLGMFPLGTKVKFTFAELGLTAGSQFRISNSFATFRVKNSSDL